MYKNIKRFFDFLVSFIVLILLSPLLIPISIGLKLTGEGYIFYLQKRVGFKNNIFNIYKFATMLKDSPNMAGGIITTKKDPRITPMGGFLRKSKINELPQLFNVVCGYMSLIGPRPQTLRCFQAFPKNLQDQIVSVRPGLSGIGSIFFRNEELMLTEIDNADEFYDSIIMPYKGKLEVWYVRNNTILLYFILIFATIYATFTGKMLFRNKFLSALPANPKELNKYLLT